MKTGSSTCTRRTHLQLVSAVQGMIPVILASWAAHPPHLRLLAARIRTKTFQVTECLSVTVTTTTLTKRQLNTSITSKSAHAAPAGSDRYSIVLPLLLPSGMPHVCDLLLHAVSIITCMYSRVRCPLHRPCSTLAACTGTQCFHTRSMDGAWKLPTQHPPMQRTERERARPSRSLSLSSGRRGATLEHHSGLPWTVGLSSLRGIRIVGRLLLSPGATVSDAWVCSAHLLLGMSNMRWTAVGSHSSRYGPWHVRSTVRG